MKPTRHLLAVTLLSLSMGAFAHGQADRHAYSSESADSVRQVQQKLNDSGFNVGRVDGIMGPRTESALRAYQQQNGMDVTGRLDDRTMSSLGMQSDSSMSVGSSSSTGGSGSTSDSSMGRSSTDTHMGTDTSRSNKSDKMRNSRNSANPNAPTPNNRAGVMGSTAGGNDNTPGVPSNPATPKR